MNLRELCQISEFPVVLLTTFNFDPLFFERVVLRDLIAGGARNIIVMADANQVYASVEKVRGQLLALGRKYRLIPISTGGAFHPKLCIRLSAKGGIVACGSHNLSRSGWLGKTQNDTWSGNREASTAWRIEPGSPSVIDLKNNLILLSELCESSQSRDVVLELLDLKWMAEAQGDRSQNWLWTVTGKKTALSFLLEQRWKGRRFDRLRMVTGSTDNNAAMIRWASETFDIKQAFLEVDKDCCDLSPLLLKNIPLDFRLNLTKGNPRSHLKVALFESNQSSAAVVGSANCSSAAWLRSFENQGNIESVVIYDDCVPSDFYHLFLTINDSSIPWHEAELKPQAIEEKANKESLSLRQLRQIQLEKSTNSIYVKLSPNPPADQQVVVVVGKKKIALSFSQSQDMWTAQFNECPVDICTPFAWVEIGVPGEPTNEVWIDDLDSLANSSGWKMPLGSMRHFGRHMLSAEYRRLLNDIRLLSGILLNNNDDFQDGILSQRQSNNKDTVNQQAKPVDIRSLIKSISDLQGGSRHFHDGAKLSASLSLTGVMRLFFYEADTTDNNSYDPTKAESEKSEVEKDQNEDEESDDDNNTDQIHEPTDVDKRRLLQQLNEFADNLSSVEFADKCSARQLQQAVAYPLAVAKFVSQGPWVKDINDELANIIIRVIEILLKRQVIVLVDNQNRELKPLLEEVLERYRKENREEDFWRIIGDGVLWLILTSSLIMIQKQNKPFELALLVADVALNHQLTARTNCELVMTLAKRLANECSSLGRITKLSVITEAVGALEGYLQLCWKEYKKEFRVFDDKVGDWLWRPNTGFARIVSREKGCNKAKIHVRSRAMDLRNHVHLDYYLNIRQLQARDARLSSLVDILTYSIWDS